MNHAPVPTRSSLRCPADWRGRARRGFTLVELLVVITIIGLVSAALLPAFTRLIESNNYASAVNTVAATLGSARATAVQTGKPAGVVFLWDAQREVTTLLVVTQGAREAGVLTNRASGGGVDRYAGVLHPAPLAAPIELPRGMGVFGLCFTIDTLNANNGPADRAWDRPIERGPDVAKWYAGEAIGINNTSTDDDVRLWLFPRNDPRVFTAAPATAGLRLGEDPWVRLRGLAGATISPAEATLAVRHANSFFVQFGPDGALLSPERSGGDEVYNYYLEFPSEPIDPTSTLVPVRAYDDPGRFDPENAGGVSDGNRQRNPEVILRTAEQIAVADVGRLSEGVGIPRAWLVRTEISRAPAPQWLIDGGYRSDERARAVSRWIDLNAEVVSFNRYSGNAVRRTAS